MFGPCPVVRVKHDNPEGFVDINEADFDPERHALFDESAGDGADEAPDDKPDAPRRGRKPKPRD